MPLSDLLRLADIAISGHAGPELPEELLRAVVEETGSRAGILRRQDDIIARWPRTVSAQIEKATEGWSEIPFGSDDGSWCLHLLHLDRLDESALGATRLGLSAWQLREELKQTKFDVRFHLWELEAIRSIATSIGARSSAATSAIKPHSRVTWGASPTSTSTASVNGCGSGYGPRRGVACIPPENASSIISRV